MIDYLCLLEDSIIDNILSYSNKKSIIIILLILALMP